jgi:hypothetical protein
MNRLQTLLSNSTCAATSRLPDAPATAAQIDASCDPVSAHFQWAGLRVASVATSAVSAWGPPVHADSVRYRGPAMRQGLTLVHFPAQLTRFLWDRGCVKEVFRGCQGVFMGSLG